jgi:hypothetical protein
MDSSTDLDQLTQKIDELKDYLDANFKFLGAGRHRHTYLLDANTVVKLPRSSDQDYWQNADLDCCTANVLEFENYEKYGKAGFYAECTLLYVDGIPLILMEYIERLDYPFVVNGVPRKDLWISEMDTDDHGRQVGVDREGNLKTFDYSHHTV